MTLTHDHELADLDARLVLGWAFVLEARRAFTHSPNSQREQDAEDALTAVNLLLDLRLKLQPARQEA